MTSPRGDALFEKVLRLTEKPVAYAPLLLVALIAVVFAFRTPKEAPRHTATDAERRSMFASIAANELIARREVIKDFPADAWSQDDAFHEREFQRIRSNADSHDVPLVDAVRALDDGLRLARNGRFKATVPPCRPRPIY